MSADSDKQTSTEKVEKYGWRLDMHNHSTPYTSHFFYIRDFRYKHTRIFSVGMKSFHELQREELISRDECVNFIAEIMKKFSKKKRLNDIEQKAIVPVLVNYTRQTKNYEVWRMAQSQETRLHMVINIYHDRRIAAANAVVIRPFIAVPDGVMHTADDIMSLTAQVHDIDRQNNPDWFK